MKTKKLFIGSGLMILAAVAVLPMIVGAAPTFPPPTGLTNATFSTVRTGKLNVQVSSGGAATIGGPNNVATGNYAFASGESARATGAYSTAMGFGTTASNSVSTAIGDGANASGSSAVAIGTGTNASGHYSTALGDHTSATNFFATAMGTFTFASGQNSTAMGNGSSAQGNSSTAMGRNTIALGDYSTALGYDSSATGYTSFASGSTNLASGNYSTALGYTTTAQAYASTVVGQFNQISGTTDSWIAGDPLFVIGNGTSSVDRSNAVTVLKNGDVGIGTTTPETKLSISGENGLSINVTDPANPALKISGGDGEFKVSSMGNIVTSGGLSLSGELSGPDGGQVNTGPISVGGSLSIRNSADYGHPYFEVSEAGVISNPIVKSINPSYTSTMCTNAGGTWYLESGSYYCGFPPRVNDREGFVVTRSPGVGVGLEVNGGGGTVKLWNDGGIHNTGNLAVEGSIWNPKASTPVIINDAEGVKIQNGSGVDRVTIDSSGNLTTAGRLGVGTTASIYNLDVAGTANLNKGLTGVALRVNSAEALWDNGTYFSWGFGRTANYFANRVGIGVTAPAYPLDVAGDIRTNGWLRSTSGLDTSGSVYAGGVVSESSIYAKTNLMAEGNVGAGTLSPAYKLDVAGTANLNKGLTGVALRVNAAEALWDNGTYFSWGFGRTANYFARNTFIGPEYVAPSFNLVVNGDAAKLTSAWALYSDARLKDIKGKYEKGLDEIMKLNPVKYNYKKDNARNLPYDEEYVGFIAQEVLPFFPEAVDEDDDGYFDFDFHSIHVAVINAIQELKQEKDSEVAELKAELAELKALVCELKPSAGQCAQ